MEKCRTPKFGVFPKDFESHSPIGELSWVNNEYRSLYNNCVLFITNGFSNNFSLQNFDFVDFEDTLEDCLDSIWTQSESEPYPEERFLGKLLQPTLLIIAAKIQLALSISLWAHASLIMF